MRLILKRHRQVSCVACEKIINLKFVNDMESLNFYYEVSARITHVDVQNKTLKEKRKYLIESSSLQNACFAAVYLAERECEMYKNATLNLEKASLMKNIHIFRCDCEECQAWAKAVVKVFMDTDKGIKETNMNLLFALQNKDAVIDGVRKVMHSTMYDYEIVSTKIMNYSDYISMSNTEVKNDGKE